MADKLHFIAIVLILFLPLLWVANQYNVLKPVNPANPFFNPEHFSFYDYIASPELLEAALQSAFPVGVTKAYVDQVLDEKAQEAKEYKDGVVVHYYIDDFRAPHHIFLFNKDLKLINIHSSAGGYKLYADQFGYRDVMGWTEEQKRNH